MKRPILTILLILFYWSLPAQDSQYQPLEELGWEMTAFAIPDQLTELDTGAVKYLVTLNDEGKVTRLKILNNTFDAKVEKLWQRAVRNSGFTRTDGNDDDHPKKSHIGTTIIKREYCNPKLTVDN